MALKSSCRKDRIFNAMRFGANVLVLSGYFLLLNVDVLTGVTVRLLSAALVIPWMIHNKLWDSCTVMGVMGGMDLHKLLVLLLGL